MEISHQEALIAIQQGTTMRGIVERAVHKLFYSASPRHQERLLDGVMYPASHNTIKRAAVPVFTPQQGQFFRQSGDTEGLFL